MHCASLPESHACIQQHLVKIWCLPKHGDLFSGYERKACVVQMSLVAQQLWPWTAETLYWGFFWAMQLSKPASTIDSEAVAPCLEERERRVYTSVCTTAVTSA